MRVPTVDAPRVAPITTPTPSLGSVATPGTLGVGAQQDIALGNAGVRAGVGLSDMAAQMQERDNVTAVQTAMSGLQAKYTDYRNQIDQLHGIQANGITDKSKDWWTQQIADGSSSLQNDAQREAFNLRASQLQEASLRSIGAYETGQRRQATQDTATAANATAISAAVANANGWQPPQYTAGKPAGLVTPGNIDIMHRPILHNPDGSYSTVRSITITDDKGRGILLPTVGPQGQNWTPKQAIENYKQTGQNLGVFANEQAANAYSQQLHEQQAQLYGNGNTDPITVAKGQIISSTAALAQLNGWSAATALAYGDEQLTKLHVGVIDSMLAQHQVARAQAYFNANKQDINGLVQPKIERALQLGTIKQTAQAFADKVVVPGANEVDALAAARKEFSGEQETAAVNEIKTRFSEQEQIRLTNERNAADDAWQFYDQNNTLPSAATLAAMPGQARAELEKYAQAKARGLDTVTDWPTYHNLMVQASTDPTDFAKVDLNNYRTKIAAGQMHELIDMQANILNPSKQHDVVSLGQQLANAHNRLGWTTKDDQQKMGQFDYAVQQEIAAESQAKKRPLSSPERQQIIDRLSLQQAAPWYERQSTQPYMFQVEGTPGEASFTPVIPDQDKAQITAALQRRGIPVTDQTIMKVYKAAHGLQ